ncbi:helix-turn-helix transcriptional regulator [Gallaecimonas kandeliae]|uniref:helix-turn-helix domain-containing protein n=1 Tax=Gallaecimonas kandeliae TaxID=3029055 RepID=UPI00264A08BD|nr:helix-turn-helix transcriptional regulator [Gallaecimonas kandeliae]WKE65054.1 helix-turn-helix transcriptional regulator [Gallaecimonas kandeliae]
MLGARLKEERERLGLTQPVFAAQADTKKGTVINWEKDASSPTAVQLAALAKIGVDVLYVVTGQRTQQVLSEEMAEIITLYQAAPIQVRAAVHGALTAGNAKVSPQGGSIDNGGNSGTVRVTGNGNTVAGRDIKK